MRRDRKECDLLEHMKKAMDRGVMKLSGIYKSTGDRFMRLGCEFEWQ